MSLVTLVLIVAIGIAAVVLSVHLTGGSKRAQLDSEEHARARFAEDYPSIAILTVHLTADRSAAVMTLGDGRMGIVQAIGGKFLTRLLAQGDLVGVPRASDCTVSIRLADFTWRWGEFTFEDRETALRVEAMFGALRKARRWEEVA